MARRVTAADFDFSNAPKFRKTATLDAANVVVAKGGEEVVTLQPDGKGGEFVETTKTAKPNDKIVHREANDRYIIDSAKFDKLYEINPENPDTYRSTNTGRAILMEEDIVILASWGEDQNIAAGGILFKSDANGEVYGNQKHSFEGDFAREGIDDSLMPLTAPLAEQKEWAQNVGEVEHLKDVMRRIEIAQTASRVSPNSAFQAPSLDAE